MTMRSVLLSALGVIAFAAAPVSAATIGYNDVDNCFGTNTCTVGDATAQAIGGNFSGKELGGWSGFGVNSGVDAEIDGSEAIDIIFQYATTVQTIDLIFLYEPTAYNDQEISGGGGNGSDETAAIEAFFGAQSLGIVYVNVDSISQASATSGSVTNLSLGQEGSGGAWQLTNPFGTQMITRLRFFSGDAGSDGTYSDFALGTTSYTRVPGDITPVPEPASMLLLGSGLAGAALTRMRRNRRQ